jgi:hypothetical protein
MINDQREFWSKVAQNYDRVVDLLELPPSKRTRVAG